jgi:sugar/nucleoside kinase (ribokinase family)
MSARVISYGELGVDNIIRVPHLPSPEVAAFPTGDSYQIGGAAANCAIWLASWAVPVVLTGNAIGDDGMGRQLQDWLLDFPSIERRWLAVEGGAATPFCRILVTPDAERTILVFGYPEAVVVPLEAAMLDGVGYVSIDLYGGAERMEAARLAQQHGARTVVNDVIDPAHAILRWTDVVVNSAAYLRMVYPDAEVEEHARRLRSVRGATVVTTDGPRPIHVLPAKGDPFRLQPPPAKALVDATGAGDAFRAGLIHGLLQGWDLADCVRWGAAAGSLKVGRSGGGHLPPVGQVAAHAQAASLLAAAERGQ